MEAQSTAPARPSDTVVKLNALLDLLSARNKPVSYRVRLYGTYRTARAVLQFFALLWWALIVIGALLLVGSVFFDVQSSFVSNANEMLAPVGAVLIFVGLAGVQLNQTARALVDTADYTRQHLEIVALAWGIENAGGKHGPDGLL